jgi:putative membrane protein
MQRPRWQQQGEEPDYRFTMSNERTFLAWVRTALAVLAGGVALDQFGGELWRPGVGRAISVVLALFAALLSAAAYRRWKASEIAMRLSEPLPPARVVPLTAVLLLLLAGGLAVLIVLSR